MRRPRRIEPTPNQRIRGVYLKMRKSAVSAKDPTRRRLADALGVSIYTVNSWFYPPGRGKARRAPVMAAQLAEGLWRDGILTEMAKEEEA